MKRLLLMALSGLLIAPAAVRADEFDDRPIPQDPARQARDARASLAWQRRTLVDAYEQVGTKDPRWDAPARAALESAARFFCGEVDPLPEASEVHALVRKAIDAGCGDPLMLYLDARTSAESGGPGPAEVVRRYLAAADALKVSRYPALRRANALVKAGQVKAAGAKLGFFNLNPAAGQEAARWLDAALALFPEGAADVDFAEFAAGKWAGLAEQVFGAERRLLGGFEAASEHVDEALARSPGLESLRLYLKGSTLIDHAWEARGNGTADTITVQGGEKFKARLAEAESALRRSWALQPRGVHTPLKMLVIMLGRDHRRAEMEIWFDRAMKADDSSLAACDAKIEWLDPKWHGDRESLLAFGRACRATKNWRSRIPLLLAEAHYRAATSLPDEEQDRYFQDEAAWGEIREVCQEYLRRFPRDDASRSMYASYAFLWNHFDEADRQFKALGERLVGSGLISLDFMKSYRTDAAAIAEPPAPR